MASTLPPIESHPPSEEGPGGSSFQRGVQWVFLGPNGIRAGWRMLIAVALFVLFALVIQAILKHIPPLEAWQHAQSRTAFTPALLILAEGVSVLSLVLAVLVMTFIEKRTFADYGWPGKEAFGKRFWQGVPYGFAMLTALMALIAAFHGFSHGGWALGRAEAVKYGVLYLIGFILVGIFEEFAFRGYLQATLASGIGFWPAAFVMAIVFGAIHLGNTGEAAVGALSAGSFGFLAAFTLWRTGNIWFAIGMHAAWDWGETYFYSVPDSGNLAQGHLLNSSLHGPNWLAGGSVGPEGSVFVFLVLVLAGVGIHFLFPAKQRLV
jgi:membrane protease YdiL (CAAX protease family)